MGSTIQVEIRRQCTGCTTDEDITELTASLTDTLREYIDSGSLTNEIQGWAHERVPGVGQLFNAIVDASTFQIMNVVSPFAARDYQYYPDWATRENASTTASSLSSSARPPTITC